MNKFKKTTLTALALLATGASVGALATVGAEKAQQKLILTLSDAGEIRAVGDYYGCVTAGGETQCGRTTQRVTFNEQYTECAQGMWDYAEGQANGAPVTKTRTFMVDKAALEAASGSQPIKK